MSPSSSSPQSCAAVSFRPFSLRYKLQIIFGVLEVKVHRLAKLLNLVYLRKLHIQENSVPEYGVCPIKAVTQKAKRGP